jgi:non-ribosomal peptide synthetase-like protein
MSPSSRAGTVREAAPLLLHEFFLESARLHPDTTALVIPAGEGRARLEWTYRELEARSRALAEALMPLVEPDQLVAIRIARENPELYLTQLAVLRAGAAFVSIDPTLPLEYARHLVSDSGTQCVLSDDAGLELAGTLAPARSVRELAQQAGQPLVERAQPHGLAYSIYTSGTTGKPKGVLIEHHSIVNLVASDRAEFQLGPGNRCAQGSSPAYDSSIEETWLAWSSGATLVVLDDKSVRSGPDLIAWLQQERISVFCPPPTLLRASGCKDPERELPLLKLLYVGGEALPEDVAELWGRGRRLENGYGPTECSVTATRTRIQPGQPITIGRPVPGNRAYLLDENLRQVPSGEVGELVIAGAGLARGYRNLPQLTAERFPTVEGLGRVYRTGDLARFDERGDLVYLGRRDTQVKVRGHRIELEAIETRLSESPGVRAAACKVQGEGSRKVVMAYIVPEQPAAPPDTDALRAHLAAELPAPMVPARIGILEQLPTSVGGKLDRKRLPDLDLSQAQGARIAAETELERELEARFRAALRLGEPVSVEADFFLDLGGDSLAAAELVSALRESPTTQACTVRMLYDARNVRALAAALERAPEPPKLVAEREPRLDGPSAHWVTAAQAAWIVLELIGVAWVLQAAVFDWVPWSIQKVGLLPLLFGLPFLAFGLALLWAPIALGLTLLAKQLLIGRYTERRAPAWSSFHLRQWIVARLARRIPWSLLALTGLCSPVLRSLGARIGRRVHLHHGIQLSAGGWDLLEIGDDAMLSQDAALRLVDLEDGAIRVAPIRIGARATLGIRAGMAGGSELGEDSELGSLSFLQRGTRTGAGERWDGVPAERIGSASPAPMPVDSAVAPALHGAALLCARALASAAVQWPFLALLLLALGPGVLDGSALSAWLAAPRFEWNWFGLMILVLVARLPVTIVCQGLLVRLLSPTEPKVIARYGWSYLRVVIAKEQATAAGDWLSGTVFYPAWLRLAGMRIGQNCEISTLIDLLPALVEISDECFFADGIYLGGPELKGGTVRLARTRFGRDTFLGNHCVIPIGAQLPDGILIGVSTVADDRRIERGSSWFGHPAFELARPAQTEFDREFTHDPSLPRRISRWFWEGLRFALPIPLAAVYFVWVLVASQPPWLFEHGKGVLAGAAALVLASFSAYLFILALKWALLGKVKPGVHPLWSCWCSRWDFLYVAWTRLGRNVLGEVEGTLLLNAGIRMFGMRIGKRALLGSGFAQVVDPDMLIFEDGVTVTGNFQAHTFEDRVLKIGELHIREGASVGSQTVLFYGADIGARARVMAHSVVLKGERLAPDTEYAGVPTLACAARNARIGAHAGSIRRQSVADQRLVFAPADAELSRSHLVQRAHPDHGGA